jgi:hypothetical protein
VEGQIDDALRGHEQGRYVAIVSCLRARGDLHWELSFLALFAAHARKGLAQVGL